MKKSDNKCVQVSAIPFPERCVQSIFIPMISNYSFKDGFCYRDGILHGSVISIADNPEREMLTIEIQIISENKYLHNQRQFICHIFQQKE